MTATATAINAILDAAAAKAAATNRSSDLPNSIKFIVRAMGIERIIGKRAAEAAGERCTAEILLGIIDQPGSPGCVTEKHFEEVRKLANFFATMEPNNEFESNVLQHTLQVLIDGTVSPRSAAFVVWCGKVWRDRLATQAALEEVATVTVPTGTVIINAVFQGVEIKNTSYGVFYVHSFRADDGKSLQWWTTTDWSHNPATNPNAPKDGDRVSLKCRFKQPTIWRGQVTYKVTHCKFTKA